MRLNQVEPIRPSDFRWAPSALSGHAIALSDDEASLDGGVTPVEHDPMKQSKIELFGLEEDQSAGV